jgi:hypothetical protein
MRKKSERDIDRLIDRFDRSNEIDGKKIIYFVPIYISKKKPAFKVMVVCEGEPEDVTGSFMRLLGGRPTKNPKLSLPLGEKGVMFSECLSEIRNIVYAKVFLKHRLTHQVL